MIGTEMLDQHLPWEYTYDLTSRNICDNLCVCKKLNIHMHRQLRSANGSLKAQTRECLQKLIKLTTQNNVILFRLDLRLMQQILCVSVHQNTNRSSGPPTPIIVNKIISFKEKKLFFWCCCLYLHFFVDFLNLLK